MSQREEGTQLQNILEMQDTDSELKSPNDSMSLEIANILNKVIHEESDQDHYDISSSETGKEDYLYDFGDKSSEERQQIDLGLGSTNLIRLDLGRHSELSRVSERHTVDEMSKDQKTMSPSLLRDTAEFGNVYLSPSKLVVDSPIKDFTLLVTQEHKNKSNFSVSSIDPRANMEDDNFRSVHKTYQKKVEI